MGLCDIENKETNQPVKLSSCKQEHYSSVIMLKVQFVVTGLESLF